MFFKLFFLFFSRVLFNVFLVLHLFSKFFPVFFSVLHGFQCFSSFSGLRHGSVFCCSGFCCFQGFLVLPPGFLLLPPGFLLLPPGFLMLLPDFFWLLPGVWLLPGFGLRFFFCQSNPRPNIKTIGDIQAVRCRQTHVRVDWVCVVSFTRSCDARYGLPGVRVGEARNPGPPSASGAASSMETTRSSAPPNRFPASPPMRDESGRNVASLLTQPTQVDSVPTSRRYACRHTS